MRRVAPRLDEQDFALTRKIIDEILAPYAQMPPAMLPADVAIDGLFLPALYLRLPEKYGVEKGATTNVTGLREASGQ